MSDRQAGKVIYEVRGDSSHLKGDLSDAERILQSFKDKLGKMQIKIDPSSLTAFNKVLDDLIAKKKKLDDPIHFGGSAGGMGSSTGHPNASPGQSTSAASQSVSGVPTAFAQSLKSTNLLASTPNVMPITAYQHIPTAIQAPLPFTTVSSIPAAHVAALPSSQARGALGGMMGDIMGGLIAGHLGSGSNRPALPSPVSSGVRALPSPGNQFSAAEAGILGLARTLDTPGLAATSDLFRAEHNRRQAANQPTLRQVVHSVGSDIGLQFRGADFVDTTTAVDAHFVAAPPRLSPRGTTFAGSQLAGQPPYPYEMGHSAVAFSNRERGNMARFLNQQVKMDTDLDRGEEFGGLNGESGSIGPRMANGNFGSGGGGIGGWLKNRYGGGNGAFGQLKTFMGSRYVRAGGAVAIVEGASQFINQQNQFHIGMAGANSAADVAHVQMQYQQNSPLANIPFGVGQLGMGIREMWTGDQAAITGSLNATSTQDKTAQIMMGNASNKLSLRAQAAGASGDFAGQRTAVALNSQNATQSVSMQNAMAVGKLASANAAITATGVQKHWYNPSTWGKKEGQLTAEDQQNIGANQGQINQINKASADNAAGQAAVAAQQQAAINRQEDSSIIGSNGRRNAIRMQFGDRFGASQASISSDFNSRIAATSDRGEQSRLGGERDDTINANKQEYNRDTTNMEGGNRVQSMFAGAQVLSMQHQDFAASMANFRAQKADAAEGIRQARDGVNFSDPDQVKHYNAAVGKFRTQSDLADAGAQATQADRDANKLFRQKQNVSLGQSVMGDQFGANNTSIENNRVMQNRLHPDDEADNNAQARLQRQGNFQDEGRRIIGVKESIRDINRSTAGSHLRSQGQFLTAGVGDIYGQAQDEIEQLNNDPSMRGRPDLDKLRNEKIAAIKSNASGMAHDSTDVFKYGVRGEQVSGFVTGGDRNNQYAYKDLANARKGIRARDKTLDDTDKGSNPGNTGSGRDGPTADQIDQLNAKMDAFIQQMKTSWGG